MRARAQLVNGYVPRSSPHFRLQSPLFSLTSKSNFAIIVCQIKPFPTGPHITQPSNVCIQLATIGVENNVEFRSALRELLFTANVSEYIAGVIMYEETLSQSCKDGTPFVQALASRGILIGIKVDKGVVHLPGSDRETTTAGLDGTLNNTYPSIHFIKPTDLYCSRESIKTMDTYQLRSQHSSSRVGGKMLRVLRQRGEICEMARCAQHWRRATFSTGY